MPLQKADKHLPVMAEMLGIDAEQMRKWLCHKKIVTAHEVLTKPLSISQVSGERKRSLLLSHQRIPKHMDTLCIWIILALT